LIKEMVKAVLINNITIDTAKLGAKQQRWLFFKSCKIFIRIRTIKIQFGIVVEANGEVHEVLTDFMVIKYLWCPNPFDIAKLFRIQFCQIKDAVLPIDQIVRFH